MLKVPLWLDGITPTAHHFQRADEYHKECVRRAVARVNPDAWGFNEIDFDEGALGHGKLDLRRLDLTLEDLTEIFIAQGDGALTRAFPGLNNRDSIGIYVGIVAVQHERPNAAPSEDLLARTRYRIVPEKIPDDANGKPPKDAQWLRPIPWLLVDGDRMDGFDLVQCARIVADAKGRPIFDRSFIPPIWRVRASPYLQERFEALLLQLRESEAWARKWKPPSEKLERRRALRGHLLCFSEAVQAILDRPVTAPHDAYLKLLEILYTLTPFTPEGESDSEDEGSLPFDQRDLSKTFRTLFDALQLVLSHFGAEQHLEIPLLPVGGDGKTVRGDLSRPEGIFRREFYLAVWGDDLDCLREEVPKLVKIAPLQDLLNYKYANTSGVPLYAVQKPNGLPDVPGALYFRLDEASDIWTAIKRSALLGAQLSVKGLAKAALFAVDPRLQ